MATLAVKVAVPPPLPRSQFDGGVRYGADPSPHRGTPGAGAGQHRGHPRGVCDITDQ